MTMMRSYHHIRLLQRKMKNHHIHLNLPHHHHHHLPHHHHHHLHHRHPHRNPLHQSLLQKKKRNRNQNHPLHHRHLPLHHHLLLHHHRHLHTHSHLVLLPQSIRSYQHKAELTIIHLRGLH